MCEGKHCRHPRGEVLLLTNTNCIEHSLTFVNGDGSVDCLVCICRLECLIVSGDETCEAGDLDLIQHMNVDMLKLTRLLNGEAIARRSLLARWRNSIVSLT